MKIATHLLAVLSTFLQIDIFSSAFHEVVNSSDMPHTSRAWGEIAAFALLAMVRQAVSYLINKYLMHTGIQQAVKAVQEEKPCAPQGEGVPPALPISGSD